MERDDKDAVGCNLGLIRGNRLGEAVPASSFLEAAPLPPAIKSRLREKVGRWARAVGNVKESMIYLLSLDRLTSEGGDDDDDDDDDDEMTMKKTLREPTTTSWTTPPAWTSPRGCDDTHVLHALLHTSD